MDKVESGNNENLSSESLQPTTSSLISPESNRDQVQPTSPEPSASNDNATQIFLAEMEHDFPGSTSRAEWVQPYFPDHGQPSVATSETMSVPTQQPITTTTKGSTSSAFVNHAEDRVRAVRSVGPATEEHLASLNIRTAGQLAHADPNQLASLERITPSRANQLVNAAQAYVARPEPISSPLATQNDDSPQPMPATSQLGSLVSGILPQNSSAPSPPNATQVVATVDASDTDDGRHLATNMRSAISNASHTGQIPSINQATQIARESGLPPIHESAQFVQVASAMNLSPQQAQSVIGDVQTSGQMGTDITRSIRSSLSSLTLPTSGKPLDDSGLSSAVSNLERAAQALVGATHNLDGVGHHSGNPSTEDRVAAGASSVTPQSVASSEP